MAPAGWRSPTPCSTVSRWTVPRASVLLEGKGARLPNVQILKGGGRGTGNAYIGWDGTYCVQLRRAGHPGRIHHRQQDDRAAAVGAAQLHGRRQRVVRRAALRGEGRIERRVRRRRRHRQDRRRHQRQQRADDGAARGRVSPALGVSHRSGGAEPGKGRRRHVHGPRYLARSRTCVCSCPSSRRSRPPSSADRCGSSAS